MISNDTILWQSPYQNAHFELSDGFVVQITDKLHTLNETAREVFEMFDGTRNCNDVIYEFIERYPDNDSVGNIIGDFIKRLYEAGLLVEH